MPDQKIVVGPENTAVRVALWRALHVEIDAPPHVFEDEIGLKLAAPDDGWRNRPDMHPQGTAPFRASIVARSRFIEDQVIERKSQGVDQYVILGAGLDTFVQRHHSIEPQLHVFEVDQPGPQTWKKQRLEDLGLSAPECLTFVPVDFEAGDDWWQRLKESGFNTAKPAIVASAGVSMYLTKESIAETLRQVSTLASGSIFVMSFLLPIAMADEQTRPGIERSIQGARASGTPMISFFMPDEMMDLARQCGFTKVQHVSADALAEKYFSGRSDGLRPPSNCEELLLATT